MRFNVVERLVADAAGERGVARHDHDILVASAQIAAHRHPEASRKRGSSVTACAPSALTSAGERIPSSKRLGAVGPEPSEEFDFISCIFGFYDCVGRCSRFRRWFEFFYDRLSGAVAGDDLDLLLCIGKSFLTNFY